MTKFGVLILSLYLFMKSILYHFTGLPPEQLTFDSNWHKRFLQRHSEITLRATFASNRKKAREWTQGGLMFFEINAFFVKLLKICIFVVAFGAEMYSYF